MTARDLIEAGRQEFMWFGLILALAQVVEQGAWYIGQPAMVC